VIRRVTPGLGLLAALLVIYLAAPFLAGLQRIFDADWHGADTTGLLDATGVSLASATLATVLVSLTGVPLGYLLARRDTAGMRILGILVQMPLALPPLSSGVLLLFLLGAYAPLSQVLGDVTDSFTGIVLAEAFVAAPFLIIAARAAFAAVDPVLEDVAATLGHGPRRRFLRVSLPLAWPMIASGMLMCWLRAFGEFGATVLVAYHPYSLPVYTYVAFGSEGLPAMLPVLMPTLATAIGMIMLGEWLRRRHRTRPALDLLDEVIEGPPEARHRPPPAALAWQFRRTVPGFTLDVAWAPTSARLAILGASGSGKSMTLRLLAGLERAAEGHITLGDRDVTCLPPERRDIGYMPQSPSLLPDRTLLAQLLLPVGARADAARLWIARVGLAGLEDRRPAELSLGQQQRAALGRALMRPSRLLLLDEPFSALDAPLRRQMQQDLVKLQADLLLTTLLVTHDPDEALLLADEILVIDGGRVLQTGRVTEVFLRPANAVVARLLGAGRPAHGVAGAGAGIAIDGIAIDGIAIGGGVTLAVGGQPVPSGRVSWAVRPEWVRPDPLGAYAGVIETIIKAGPFLDLGLRLGDAELVSRVPRGASIECGPSRFAIEPGAIQVWPGEDAAF
jgi:ABC-type Fe3+/spermidine/putrescine transport system ATPase subunit/ABC-type sulfate transport system permease component